MLEATRYTPCQVALERFERATELPLLILALAMIPLLLAPVVGDLSDPAEASRAAHNWGHIVGCALLVHTVGNGHGRFDRAH